jgi:hypothetical protein
MYMASEHRTTICCSKPRPINAAIFLDAANEFNRQFHHSGQVEIVSSLDRDGQPTAYDIHDLGCHTFILKSGPQAVY